MTSPLPALGFVGLGLLGTPMSLRLLAAGHPLTVWNRDPSKAEPLVAAGARSARDLAALAAESDVIFVCVSDAAAVREVVTTMLPSLRKGALVVDFSSIDPVTTRELAASLAERGVALVDAPVSGGVRGAEAGTLAIMAGGTEAAVERLRPYAAVLGRRLTRVGDVGAGQVAKICNQLVVACSAVAFAEVVALAEAAGIDAGALPSALEGGFADSLPFRILVPRMAARSFTPVEWKVRTLAKDLGMAHDLGASVGVDLPMVEAARARYATHVAAGHADDDPSTLITLLDPGDRAG